jgi:hypothetical protein
MRTRLLVPAAALALLGLALRPVLAAAQDSPSVDQLTVSFWPEYDRPDVLVIFRLHLADSTQLPTHVRVPIPASVSTLNAVAMRNAQDALVNANYTRQTEGDSAYLVVDSSSLDVQVEFYLALARTGQARSFAFTWPGGLAAADFLFEVQEPVGASSLQMEPAPQSQVAGEFGLTYQRSSLGAIDESATPSASFSYNRSTDRLTADFVQAQTPLGTPESPGGRTPDLTRYLPWALLALGLLLMAAGGVYYLRTMRPSKRGERRHLPTRRAERADEDVDPAPVYCHTCGARASASDRFCRQCGTQLRR